MADFATSLIGRRVQFTEHSELFGKGLSGKVGEIVSAYVNNNGNIRYQVEVDGVLVTPPLEVGSPDRPCMLLPRVVGA